MTNKFYSLAVCLGLGPLLQNIKGIFVVLGDPSGHIITAPNPLVLMRNTTGNFRAIIMMQKTL